MDGNAKTDVSNRREPGMFCGEAEQPQTFISETSYVKITFYAENYTDQVNIVPAIYTHTDLLSIFDTFVSIPRRIFRLIQELNSKWKSIYDMDNILNCIQIVVAK